MQHKNLEKVENEELRKFFLKLEDRFSLTPPSLMARIDHEVFRVIKPIETFFNDKESEIKEIERNELAEKLSADFFSLTEDNNFIPNVSSDVVSYEIVNDLMKNFKNPKIFTSTHIKLLDLKGNFHVAIFDDNLCLYIHFWFDT